MLPVTLTCWSNEQHLSQIFAGLAMLHGQGRINLTQKMLPMPPPDKTAPKHLEWIKNWHCRIDAGGKRYYVDTHDGHEINQEGLRDCDVYLKRSYLSGGPGKVRPLGLNYEVFADGFDWREVARRWKYNGRKYALSYLLNRHRMSVSEFEGRPLEGVFDPRVLFTCRTWKPDHADENKNEERRIINQARTDLILALRKAFGPRCIAGFERTEHALETRKRAVLEVDLPKQKYLPLMHSTPICIATVGLHGSNGWKLGEYVAASRAIVSETLRFQAPHFESGTHYLPFATPGECVEQVGKLMESPWECQKISTANATYYHQYLRPDMLVAHAIELEQGVPAAVVDRELSSDVLADLPGYRMLADTY